jgi:hypothetical protein
MKNLEFLLKRLLIVPLIFGIIINSKAEENEGGLKSKSAEVSKFEKAFVELDQYLLNDGVIIANPIKYYKFYNSKQELVYEKEVKNEEKLSKKLKEMIRKSDFVLEAYNTLYFTL